MEDRRAELERWKNEHAQTPARLVIHRVAATLGATFGFDGAVQISRKDLAAAAGLSDSTVKVAIKELVATGWLEVQSGNTGGATSDRNTLLFRFPDPRTEVTSDDDDASTGE